MPRLTTAQAIASLMAGKGMPTEQSVEAAQKAAAREGATIHDAIRETFSPAAARREKAERAQKAAFLAKISGHATAKKAEADWRKPIVGNAYNRGKAYQVAR